MYRLHYVGMTSVVYEELRTVTIALNILLGFIVYVLMRMMAALSNGKHA